MQSSRTEVDRMAARLPQYSVNLRMACILLVCLLLLELGTGPGAEASPQTAPSSSGSSAGSNRSYQRMRHYHQRAHYRHRGHGHGQQHEAADKQPEQPAPNDPAAGAGAGPGSPVSLLDEATRNQVERCLRDFVVMERCQRCASVTKSMTVFPLCCGDVDGVQVWCQEYLDFGSE